MTTPLSRVTGAPAVGFGSTYVVSSSAADAGDCSKPAYSFEAVSIEIPSVGGFPGV